MRLHAQTDSSSKEPKPPLRLFSFADPHIPTKATIYAAVLPGLGQLYNRKYWKVPVVYAAMGTATYAMLHYRSIVRDSNASFRLQYQNGKTPSAYALDSRNQARKSRDFAILAMGAIYVLQIVDATVDAHFYKININENLDARLNPAPGSLISFHYTF
ncbi:MAG: hypothetical protein KG003_08540 [Bacteroidetes bacterium]|nr:hypothetical protein [Bacteroidota bacterium]